MSKIVQAINEVMKKASYVQKQGKNEFHGYRYAGEAHLLEVIRPAMVEAGLVLIPKVTSAVGPDENGITTVTISYTLLHTSGEMLADALVMTGQGGDKNSKGVGDKGVYKAITGANKYALFKLFQIETGDDPESSASPNEQTDKPSANPKPKIAARMEDDL